MIAYRPAQNDNDFENVEEREVTTDCPGGCIELDFVGFYRGNRPCSRCDGLGTVTEMRDCVVDADGEIARVL